MLFYFYSFKIGKQIQTKYTSIHTIWYASFVIKRDWRWSTQCCHSTLFGG